MTQNDNHIIADNGKVFRRIADGTIYGREIYLGYSYYINGVKPTSRTLTPPKISRKLTTPKSLPTPKHCK